MKAVIIGGGIAGLTMALHLKRNQWDVVVCEKAESVKTRGHAFLINYEGLSVLAEFFNETSHQLLKQRVNLFSLKRPDGDEKIKIQLLDWYCMKRVDLIAFLNSFFTKNTLKEGVTFSHFLYKNKKAIAAVFENGDIEFGDLFIGADGSNSQVREVIHCKTAYSKIEVHEVVGTSKKKFKAAESEFKFQKIQSEEKGLAFGYIPASEDEMVWFMQYNVKLSNGHEGNDPEELKAFCFEMMKDFPEEVKEVLEGTDFRNAYIWKTRDFDLIPSFHKDNIVLIGDAAHLALPFTSAGTSNAIADAKCLAECLQQSPDFEAAFQSYYQLRSEKVSTHIEQGRVLKKIFLNPKKYSERGFLLPLVSATDNYKKFKDKEQLKIIYFTDPICSTCWITQPILRRLKLEYGDYIKFDYHMGGLLPSWKGFDRGGIKTPEDVAKHWEEVNASHKMILDGDVWMEDPLNSSSPPSIAFKAAQLQDSDKAITFLRRLKEFVFLEKRNITRWKIIENAALSSGLDAALLKKDIVSNGFNLFKEDLALTKEMEVDVFPTFFFTKDGVVKNTIRGYEPYEVFEDILKALIPEAKKKTERFSPVAVFSMFHNMTEEEYAFVTNTPLEETRIILNQLHDQLIINKYDTKYGVVWMFNLNSSI